MKQTVLIFGGLALIVLLLIQLSKFSLVSQNRNSDLYLAISTLLFIFVGFMLSRLFRNKSNPKAAVIDETQLQKTGLTKREYEILILMANGLSNLEIGGKLFISENTVKTHVSKVLMKLNAKRRTQAIQIAKDLHII